MDDIGAKLGLFPQFDNPKHADWMALLGSWDLQRIRAADFAVAIPPPGFVAKDCFESDALLTADKHSKFYVCDVIENGHKREFVATSGAAIFTHLRI